MEALIFGIIIFFLIFGLTYLLTFFLTFLSKSPNNLKSIRFIISGTVSIVLLLWLSITPATNHEIATIEQKSDGFQITLTGERLLLAHDPISMFSRSTYVDTFKVEIPRSNGQIRGEEIPTRSGYHSFSGMLNIQQDLLSIDLRHNNADDGTLEELSWNGTYKLYWKSKK